MKKLNKLFAILVAMAMVLSLGIVSAFAATGDISQGSADAAINPKIKKTLNVAAGVAYPNLTFTFDFTQKSGNDIANYKDANGTALKASDYSTVAKPIESKSVTFTGKTATGNEVQSVEMFNWATGHDTAYASAGQYAYVVTENKTTFTSAYGATDKVKDEVVYDQNDYFVTVYVANGENGTTFVKYVTVQKITKNQDGTFTLGEKEKVEGANEGTDGTNNGFKFDNTYKKEINPGTIVPPTDKVYTLVLDKVVTGDLGDKNKKFDFSVTVTNPATDNTAITAIIVNGTGENTKYVKETDGAFSYVTNKEDATVYTFTSGTAENIKLANGDELFFTSIPFGATYKIQETDADVNYKTGIAYTDYAANPVAQTMTQEQAATAAKTIGANPALVFTDNHETGNYATYTNEYNSTTPTGILINNLPYIALALVAIGGLVAYVVVRRRQSDEA